MVRAKNELVRVPAAAIPGVLAPTIFFLGINGVFGSLTNLTGFTSDSYAAFMVPVSMLQGAGFTGAAAGVNMARDIEQGWLDRLLVSPAPRWVLLAGTVLAAGARALIPATFVFAIALGIGAGFPGIDGLLITYAMVVAMAAVAACWGCDAGAPLQEPVGGAADAGRDAGASSSSPPPTRRWRCCRAGSTTSPASTR